MKKIVIRILQFVAAMELMALWSCKSAKPVPVVEEQLSETTEAAGAPENAVVDETVIEAVEFVEDSVGEAPAKPTRTVRAVNPVVFIGNSICQFWIDSVPDYFAENRYMDVGISGKTSRYILERFPADVVGRRPQVVVILSAITNDIAQNEGPVTDDQMIANVDSMLTLAREAGITPIMTNLVPATAFWWRRSIPAVEPIIRLNGRLAELAAERSVEIIDLFTPMAMPDGTLNPAYAYDGVHPNKAGYLLMQELVEPVIRRHLDHEGE